MGDLANLGNAVPAAKPAPAMADTDLAALFDLEMAEDERAPPPLPLKPAGKNFAKSAAEVVKPASKAVAKSAAKTKLAKTGGKAKRKPPARAEMVIREIAKPKQKATPTAPAKQPVSASLAKTRTAKTAGRTRTAKKVQPRSRNA